MFILVFTVLSLLGSFVVFRQMTVQEKVQGLATPGLFSLIVVTIAVVALVILLDKLLKKADGKWEKLYQVRWSSFVLPAFILVIGLLLYLDLTNQGLVFKQLPQEMQQRIADISTKTYSVEGRTLFFKDAIQMSKESPILGYGGEGWRVLFTKYQTVPYWSNEAHNGYLEILLSTGWVGLLLFVGVFLSFLYWSFRLYRQSDAESRVTLVAAFAAFLFVMAHSFIDFNFSFGTIWLMVIWLLVMMVPRQDKSDFNFIQPKWKWVPATVIAVVIIGSFVATLYAAKFNLAVGKMKQIQSGKQISAAEAEKNLTKAASYNPYDPDIQLRLADLYFKVYSQTQNARYKASFENATKESIQLEPNNPKVLFNAGILYLKAGAVDEGVNLLDKALEKDHFNVEFYELSQDVMSQLAFFALKQGKIDESKKFAQKVLDDYDKQRKWFKIYQDSKTQINERNFKINEKSHFFGAQAYFLLNQYDKVIEVAELSKNSSDPAIKAKSNALLVVANERLGNQDAATAIFTQGKTQSPEFPTFVAEYRAIK